MPKRYLCKMDARETARLIGQLSTLRQEIEDLAEAAQSIGDMDRYPPETVKILAEAAKEATDLKYRILTELIGAGPEVDSWRNLINEIEFTESYRVDKDFRWQRDRPNVRSLKTVAQIVENVCRHFGSEPETEPTKKRSRRRGPSADMKWHRKINAIVAGCHLTPDDLPEICKMLDKALVHVPKTWRKKDGLGTWTEALDLKDKWHIIKALNYSCTMTSKHPDR